MIILRLDVKALSLASGVLLAVFTFLIAIVSVVTGAGVSFLNLVGYLHPGYSPTFIGALIMTFWMFVYGLIGGALLAIVYNFFAKDK